MPVPAAGAVAVSVRRSTSAGDTMFAADVANFFVAARLSVDAAAVLAAGTTAAGAAACALPTSSTLPSRTLARAAALSADPMTHALDTVRSPLGRDPPGNRHYLEDPPGPCVTAEAVLGNFCENGCWRTVRSAGAASSAGPATCSSEQAVHVAERRAQRFAGGERESAPQRQLAVEGGEAASV